MNLFLSDLEMRELTGYTIPRYQREWLRKRGWRYEANAAGFPKVARAYFERRMVGETQAEDPKPVARHNFGALRMVK